MKKKKKKNEFELKLCINFDESKNLKLINTKDTTKSKLNKYNLIKLSDQKIRTN